MSTSNFLDLLKTFFVSSQFPNISVLFDFFLQWDLMTGEKEREKRNVRQRDRKREREKERKKKRDRERRKERERYQ